MIAFNNLSVGFGNHNVLNTINGSAKQGQLVALLGENGAGKSTLLHTLAGMHAFTGNVLFNNKPLAAHDKKSLATQRAVMMQANHVGFDFTVFELIAMGRYPYVESLKMQSEKVHKYAAIMDLSNYLTRRISALSGGEQQRVAIARAFATEAKILFADEPTGNLDTATGAKIVELIFDLNKEFSTTLVLVTHDERLAQRCGRIVRLIAGEIESDSGSPQGAASNNANASESTESASA